MRLRVMLVEDEPTDVALIRSALDDDVVIVGSFTALGDLLNALRDGTAPDLVIADLNLPDSQGSNTVRLLRAAHPELPIVAVTGDEGAAETARLHGADDVVQKVEVLSQLRDRVRSSRQRFVGQEASRAFHLVDTPLVVVEPTHDIALLNEEARTLLERPPEVGRAFTMLFVPEERLEVAAFLASLEQMQGERAWTVATLQVARGRTREATLTGRMDTATGRLIIRLEVAPVRVADER